MKRKLLSSLTLLSAASWAAGQTSRGVGSGLAFAPPSYATLLNPAAIVSAPSASLAGSYRVKNENPYGSFVGSTGSVGIGASYHREGAADANNKTDVMQAALGARIMFLSLGGTFRKVENQRSNFDVAGMFDLDPIRVGAVFRDMKDGADRIDGMLGIKISSVHFEVNVKKPKPFDSQYWLVDAGLALVTPDFSIAVGYDAAYDDEELKDGELHGGLSVRLLDHFFVEGMYRPFAQEWESGEYLAGARLLF